MIPLGSVNQKYNSATFDLTIDKTTYEGIDLYDYFVSKVGRAPKANEKPTFNIPKGVVIVGSTPSEPAIVAGDGWSNDTVITIVNQGKIYGRGGKGGRSAYQYKMDAKKSDDLNQPSDSNFRPARPGGTGGTAMHSPTIEIIVENYGEISGGGGGGGGLGAHRRSIPISYYGVTIGGGGTGGGAPLGSRSPNECTYSMYLEDDEFKGKKYKTLREEASDLSQVEWNYVSNQGKDYFYTRAIWGYNNIDFATPDYYTGSDSEARGFFLELEQNSDSFSSVGVTLADPNDRVYVTGFYNDGLLHFPVKTYMSQNATLTTPGLGGAGLVTNAIAEEGNHGKSYNNSYISNLGHSKHPANNVYGGAGGAIGEDGQPGTTKLYYATTNAADNSTFDFTNPALCTWLTPNAAGGKAGFIKTGNITIINKPGGITKGR